MARERKRGSERVRERESVCILQHRNYLHGNISLSNHSIAFLARLTSIPHLNNQTNMSTVVKEQLTEHSLVVSPLHRDVGRHCVIL